METLVLTVIGDDRPGLVSALSARLNAQGALWQRSQMSRLAGKFAGIVEVVVPAGKVEDLVADLESLAEQGLAVTIARTSTPPGTPTHRLSLELVGADRPGIVAEISALLSTRQISIEELETTVRHAPMAGGMLFEAHAVLAAPAITDEAELRAALEAVADELMVDVALDQDAGAGSASSWLKGSHTPSSGSVHGHRARRSAGPDSDMNVSSDPRHYGISLGWRRRCITDALRGSLPKGGVVSQPKGGPADGRVIGSQLRTNFSQEAAMQDKQGHTIAVDDAVFRQVYDSPASLPGSDRWVTSDEDVREIEKMLGMQPQTIGAPLWVSGDTRTCSKCDREVNWLDIVASGLSHVHSASMIAHVILGTQKYVNTEAPRAIAHVRCVSCGTSFEGLRSFKCHNWAYAKQAMLDVISDMERSRATEG